MNLGQNKFFIILGAVLVIGGGVLGWFLYQASDDCAAAEANYNAKVEKLKSLQTLPLYPEAANLQVLEDRKKRAAAEAVDLHKQLVPMSFPLEAMTPQQFHDALISSVKNLTEKAGKAGVKFDDKYFLGFSKYQTATPSTEAAPALGRQLKCIEFVVDTMIEKKVASIGEITRKDLPEEEKSRPGAQSTPPPAPRGAKSPAPAAELLFKYPFDIQFVAEEKAFQNVLNDLSKTDKQFFIIRPLFIKNQQSKSPKKIDKSRPAPATTGTSAPVPEKLQYVFGAEKLNVSLHIDSVVFADQLPK